MFVIHQLKDNFKINYKYLFVVRDNHQLSIKLLNYCHSVKTHRDFQQDESSNIFISIIELLI
jgi:hypothetical protein